MQSCLVKWGPKLHLSLVPQGHVELGLSVVGMSLCFPHIPVNSWFQCVSPCFRWDNATHSKMPQSERWKDVCPVSLLNLEEGVSREPTDHRKWARVSEKLLIQSIWTWNHYFNVLSTPVAIHCIITHCFMFSKKIDHSAFLLNVLSKQFLKEFINKSYMELLFSHTESSKQSSFYTEWNSVPIPFSANEWLKENEVYFHSIGARKEMAIFLCLLF